MPYLNKILLMGHLGKDPEISYTQGGTAVVKTSLATTEKWKDKQTGQMKELTTWHNLEVWGKSAERFAEWFKKGSGVFVEGVQHHEKYQEKYYSKVKVIDFKPLSRAEKVRQGDVIPKAESADFDDGFGDTEIPF